MQGYTQITLPSQSNASRHTQDGTARLINCYAEDTGADAKAPLTIYPSSGLDLWQTVEQSGAGGVRAMIPTDSYLYVVAGRKVTAIDTVGAKTVVMTLPGDGDVFVAKNRRSPDPQVAVVADAVGYIIEGTTPTTIVDADLPAPSGVGVIDGYFLFPTTFGRVFISGEDNGTSIDALDFGKAQRNPDNVIFALGGERDALIFGENTVEFWTNSPDGTGAFPFVPIQVVNIGCLGAKSIVQLDRIVGWYANDGTIRIQDGYSAKRISTHFIERKLSSADPATITGFGWNEIDTGHAFLAWTCASFCVVYNLRTGLWHERQSYGRTTWRGSQAVYWQGKTLVGDFEDGRIYEVRRNVATEGGEPISMTAVCSTVHQSPAAFILDEVAIDAVTGTGTEGPLIQDIDPVVLLSVSQDGGLTFGGERRLRLGRGGERLRRIRSMRFGKFGPQGATLKLVCSASVARGFMGIGLKARPLN